MDMNRTIPRTRGFGTWKRGRQVQHLPTQSLRVVPSDVFLWAAGGSILVSLAMKLFGRNQDSLFVGEWAPTLVSLGVLARMLGR